MRDILFRGKILGLTDWSYGYYAKSGENHFILLDTDNEDNYSIVDPETVGQYTGLKDKNGKRIFEGDIVQWKDENFNNYTSVVEWCGEKWNYPAFDLAKHDYECNGLQYVHEDCIIEIIGTIYDNPELLEENEQCD